MPKLDKRWREKILEMWSEKKNREDDTLWETITKDLKKSKGGEK